MMESLNALTQDDILPANALGLVICSGHKGKTQAGGLPVSYLEGRLSAGLGIVKP